MFDWSDTVFRRRMWRVDAYQIPYYSRGIEEAKRTHPRFADWYNDVLYHLWMYVVFIYLMVYGNKELNNKKNVFNN